MNRNSFKDVAVIEGNKNYEKFIAREEEMFHSEVELRSPF